MDRLTAVRVFVEVADRGSLTAAGHALDMSRAMVSRHLASLESWLEARLLHRTTRRVSLTDAGEEALARCRQLLDVAGEIRSAAGDRRVVPSGRIRIASCSTFATTHLALPLADFLEAHPGVRVELVTHEHRVDLVEERIDLAVRIGERIDASLVARRLCDCRSVLCASPGYLRRRGTPADVQALAEHACVTHAHVATDEYRFLRAGKIERAVPAGTLGTNDTAVMRRLVLEGRGIALLPTYYVVDDLRAGRLVELLPGFEPEVLGVHAVYLSREHQPLLLRSVIDHLVTRLAAEVPGRDPAPVIAED